ncbi:hypothetical protein KSX_94720 [Ktedonospora formicarum]|uniref:Uncharacterized protein n=1 Tax=Ktedonospora formicarum TaxID=2778364 RepID=A0A8J3IHM5_9CHLR|nr:hypothetical protein KSX_94720 [Ktedonospora formicarum]
MTEIHDLNDRDRQIIEEFRANGAKSGEPHTRPTSIPVEGGRIYVFAGNRGALTNPVVLQKKLSSPK